MVRSMVRFALDYHLNQVDIFILVMVMPVLSTVTMQSDIMEN